MKTLGLLGGMSWESTATYYRLINEATRQRRGGLHSAPLVLLSVDFAAIEALQASGAWSTAGEALAREAQRIEGAGADLLLICTNTMHKVADTIAEAITIPLLHIADATADRLMADGVRRVGLLGTRFTMEEPFYRDRLADTGLEVLVPVAEDRAEVDRVIYDELCLGRIEATSRQRYRRIIESLAARGAEAVIAGCTEIGLLIDQDASAVPLYDTTTLHAEAAVARALEAP